MKKILRTMVREEKGGLATYAAQFIMLMAVMLAGAIVVASANGLGSIIAAWVADLANQQPPF